MLTIADYKNWALNDQRTAVALNDGGNALTTETARMGRVTRTDAMAESSTPSDLRTTTGSTFRSTTTSSSSSAQPNAGSKG